MRRPWSALVLLSGGLLLLVALYLPWQGFTDNLSDFFGGQRGTVQQLLRLFGDTFPWDGWSSGVAPAAALSALVLVALAGAAFVRPELMSRLPLGRSALIAAYFALAVAVDLRSDARFFIGQESVENALEPHFAYGAYLALAGAAFVLLTAGLMRGREVLSGRSPVPILVSILVGGLVVGFLLPWERFPGQSQTGIDGPAAQLAAAVALCVPSVVAGVPCSSFRACRAGRCDSPLHVRRLRVHHLSRRTRVWSMGCSRICGHPARALAHQ